MLQEFVKPKQMTQRQTEVVEYALRQLTGISRSSWKDIPATVHPFFAKYMELDAWTHEPDILTLSEAALLLLRDAISQTGEFKPDAA